MDTLSNNIDLSDLNLRSLKDVSEFISGALLPYIPQGFYIPANTIEYKLINYVGFYCLKYGFDRNRFFEKAKDEILAACIKGFIISSILTLQNNAEHKNCGEKLLQKNNS